MALGRASCDVSTFTTIAEIETSACCARTHTQCACVFVYVYVRVSTSPSEPIAAATRSPAASTRVSLYLQAS